MYDVLLDEVSSAPIKLSKGSLKNEGPTASPDTGSGVIVEEETTSEERVATDDLLEDAIASGFDEEEVDELDLTPNGEWKEGQVYLDYRTCEFADSFNKTESTINMVGSRYGSLFDYFMFFLPIDCFYSITSSTNIHARSLGNWKDIEFNEYLLWIALLTVMAVVRHSDKKAYWRQGNFHFFMNIDFTPYMSYNRFIDIMHMQVFVIPSKHMQNRDPLYQIRSIIEAFNDHMKDCIVPGKLLVIDESINQWLGTGIPNLKKVPRKPHPIGQEFKTLADHHSYCILRMDTVSDPCKKEFDKEAGIKTLTATVKRLIKPWFGTGRTAIAAMVWISEIQEVCLIRLKKFFIYNKIYKNDPK